MPATTTPTNPVVRTTPLRAYPGWVVRQYADGTFDSCQVSGGIALSPGYDTFAEAVAFARSGGTVA